MVSDTTPPPTPPALPAALAALIADTRPVGNTVEADTDRVQRIADLERIKSSICAYQADLAVDLDHSVRAREAEAEKAAQAGRAAGSKRAPQGPGRGVAAQVALARHESPHRGQVLLGFAHDLATDLPRTREALREGRLNEYRAMLIARETGCLTREDRALIDEDVCGDPDLLDGLGTRRLVGEVRRRVATLDPAAVTRRARRAETERHVTLRPAPDTMTYLTALLPVAQGVAAYAALTRDADHPARHQQPQHHTNDTDDEPTTAATARSWPTSSSNASPARPAPTASRSASTSSSPTRPSSAPATNPPPSPATAPSPPRSPATSSPTSLDDTVQTWIRRLYADPTGHLVALTSKQRLVRGGLADYLHLRDQGLCRTPWCDAPVRHRDHITPAADLGPTNDTNTQGLCEACNHAKQATGWRQRRLDATRHTVETSTPTGHRYRSRAPAPPTPARHTPPRVLAMGDSPHPLPPRLPPGVSNTSQLIAASTHCSRCRRRPDLSRKAAHEARAAFSVA